MTTFEGIIYGIVHGTTEFLPLGASGHHVIIPAIFGQLVEPSPILGALYLGAFLAVLLYFRHDWASMMSSMLRILIYRKYPMTMDERIPLCIFVATLPTALGWYYLQDTVTQLFSRPIWSAASIAAFGILLAVSDSFSRKSKGTYDWNWLDSLAVGMFQMLMLIPGCGVTTGILCGSLFRNYRREAATKFALFCSAPILAAGAFVQLRQIEFHGGTAGSGVSTITFSVVVVVTLLTGLLAIGGLLKQIERNGFRAYVIYRLLVGVGAIAWLSWGQSG